MNEKALTKVAEALSDIVGDAQIAGIELKVLVGVLAAGAAIFAAGVKFGIELGKNDESDAPQG